MIKRIGAIGLFLSMILPLLGSCASQREKTYYQYFDTVITLSAQKEKSVDFEAHCTAAEKEIAKYHRALDIYHEYTGIHNLCTVNRAAQCGESVQVDRSLFDFLLQAKAAYEKTNGHMNIMMGAVTSLWNAARTSAERAEAALPSEDALIEAKKHISIESLVLDEGSLSVRITDPKASIDVGAFGKGYAAERVAELLASRGVEDGFVLDFGGNLRVLGGREEGEPFVAGIHDPQEAYMGEHILRLYLENGSLVTSGSYFRYFEVAGRRYHHLIDPETARPAERFLSVSVLGKDSGLCDAFSTALFVMTLEEGCALIESTIGYEAVWVFADGSIFKSDGIDALIAEKSSL